MARKRVEGTCRICGVEGRLSWEHVPPESAFNDQPVVRAARQQLESEELWDGKRGAISQRGSGGYTLCESCNNKTGGWYGGEYASWARQGCDHLLRIPPDETRMFRVPL